MKNKTCFIIVGPTASGKTSAAIQLAKYFNTKIISADSRQCYRELNIGVAKPSSDELKEVKHYFINSHSIHQEVNAKMFEEYACSYADTIFLKHDIAVMVGGTGLYVNAFCNGIDEIPVIAEDVKKVITENFKSSGIGWLQDQIEKNDPLYFQKGEIKNPQRLIRALEVKLYTGKSIIEYQTKQKKIRPFKIIKVGLQLSKEQLHQNINNRLDKMMDEGLLNEVKNLLPYQNMKALQTVGYKELFEYFEGNIPLDKAIENIKTNTRRYAKRQLTWFKKDKDVNWISVEENISVVETCKQML